MNDYETMLETGDQRLIKLKLMIASLIGAWRKSADTLAERGGDARWASHFYDCANELERVLQHFELGSGCSCTEPLRNHSEERTMNADNCEGDN